MSVSDVLKVLTDKQIISPEQASLIDRHEDTKPFSVHWELRSVLYIGILLFTSGAGIIIYENIDSIGHQVLIAINALLVGICFYYVLKKSLPFSPAEISNPDKFFDYVLLVGCTLLLTLEGYLQFQYQLFGTRYGLAVIIPTVLFLFCAYRFDHRGALSLGITGLASWLGLTIAPASLLTQNNFGDERLLISAMVLGTLLVLVGWLSEVRHFKAHFAYTYILLGGNLAAVAALAGLFGQPYKLVCFLFIGLLSAFFIFRARLAQSLLFLLMGVVYAYIAFTYTLMHNFDSAGAFIIWQFYFMASAGGVVFFFLKYKTFLGIKK